VKKGKAPKEFKLQTYPTEVNESYAISDNMRMLFSVVVFVVVVI